MKKLFLALIICITTFFCAKAQTPSLNKQQTLDYITKLWRANFEVKWTIVLEGKILVKKATSNTYRTDLSTIIVDSLVVSPYYDSGKYQVKEVNEDKFKMPVFWAIELESDANRLKKDLVHLVGLVKGEVPTPLIIKSI